jgi:hypothetical protein
LKEFQRKVILAVLGAVEVGTTKRNKPQKQTCKRTGQRLREH